MSFLNKYIFHSPKVYAVALGFNVFFVLLVLFLRGFDLLIFYVDAFSVAGGLSILFGLLLLVASEGAFNIFGYSFSALRADRKYKDLYEYTVAKEKKQENQKKTFVPFIVVGFIFLIISYIFSKGVTGI